LDFARTPGINPNAQRVLPAQVNPGPMMNPYMFGFQYGLNRI
jgi:hypothetical protein